jgi:predicted dehydrogenase
MHFGTDIERVESSVQMTPTGVDGMETITIFYNDGRMAVLTHSIYARSDRKGIIHGDKGYVVVENINNPQSISVYNTEDQLLAHYDVPEQVNGYEYEFRECAQMLAKGKTEAEYMPMADTIYVMEFMDHLRKQWGMVYPQEQ